MKKLIKLLFPKTYQAIYDEGYNQCWGYCNPDSDYDQYDDYPEDYYDEQDELARLHAEHCNELLEEYEEDCRREAQALAEIYLPKAPLLEIGDKVHLHSIKGMYTVTEVYTDSFAFRTNHDEKDSYAEFSDYKCHAGGIWNSHKGLK
jgi:hypothetical protein